MTVREQMEDALPVHILGTWDFNVGVFIMDDFGNATLLEGPVLDLWSYMLVERMANSSFGAGH
jgi:hypothetical protein